VTTRTNWWAWAALAVGVLPILSPLPFGIIVGIFDERTKGTSYDFSDALPVAVLCLPGVILSIIGIAVGRKRDGDGVGIAVVGGISALALSAGTLLLMFM
jgi:hypothetical protein